MLKKTLQCHPEYLLALYYEYKAEMFDLKLCKMEGDVRVDRTGYTDLRHLPHVLSLSNQYAHTLHKEITTVCDRLYFSREGYWHHRKELSRLHFSEIQKLYGHYESDIDKIFFAYEDARPNIEKWRELVDDRSVPTRNITFEELYPGTES